MKIEKKLDEASIEYSTYSGWDDVGKIFFWDDRVFRGIYPGKEIDVLDLFNCGLLDELMESGLVPRSQVSHYKSDAFDLIIEHEKIEPLTFSYEWTFTMLKDAAKLVLSVNRIAKKYDYELKDCHGSNILFSSLKPQYIDFGSFVKNIEENNWVAYEEFVKFYLRPLRVWSSGDAYTARMALFAEHGIMPTESYLRYRFNFLPSWLIRNIRKIVSGYYRYLRANKEKLSEYVKEKNNLLAKIIRVSVDKNILRIPKVSMDKLLAKVSSYKDPVSKTLWSNYHDAYKEDNNDILTLSYRFKKILEKIKGLDSIESAVDLACNQGVFSRHLSDSRLASKIYCLDYDVQAVDTLYQNIKNAHTKIKSIAVQNLVVPMINRDVPKPNERFKSDLVVALAVTHHLILTQNMPIEKIMDIFKGYSKKYVVLEFMPKGLYGGSHSPVPPDWYNIEWFRRHFTQVFELLDEEQVDDNRIVMVGKIRQEI